MPQEERDEMGRKGRERVLKRNNLNNYVEEWDKLFTDVYENHGSWEKRKNYQGWKLKEII